MGNGEWGMGNGERTKNNKIQSPPLTRGWLGWGQTIVDTLIMTYQTSSFATWNNYCKNQDYIPKYKVALLGKRQE